MQRITILGKTDKPCFQCGAKEHVVKVRFKDGSFSGNLCVKDLFSRIPAESKPDKPAQEKAA